MRGSPLASESGSLFVEVGGNLKINGSSLKFTDGQALRFVTNGTSIFTGDLGSPATMNHSQIDGITGQIDISAANLYANTITYEPFNFQSSAATANIGAPFDGSTFTMSGNELVTNTHANILRVGRLTADGFKFADNLLINVVGDVDFTASSARQINFYTLGKFDSTGHAITLGNGQTLDIVGINGVTTGTINGGSNDIFIRTSSDPLAVVGNIVVNGPVTVTGTGTIRLVADNSGSSIFFECRPGRGRLDSPGSRFGRQYLANRGRCYRRQSRIRWWGIQWVQFFRQSRSPH